MLRTLRLQGGHVKDIDSAELADGILTRAHNVNTRKNFPSRISGRRIAYGVNSGHAPLDPYHLLNFDLNTSNWWLQFGVDAISAVETSNYYDVTPVGLNTIADPSEWCSTLLNGIPIFTNGANDLLYWDGVASNPADTVPDWPIGTVCKAVVAFRYHIFAMNIDGPSGTFENQILWSDAAEPGALPASWTPSASNEAGDAILADTPGRCIGGLPLNTQLALYKPTSIYAAEYNGQPDQIFAIRAIVRSIGAAGPHCMVERGQTHIVVGNDDVVIFNGSDAVSIADQRIRRYLANSINEAKAANSFVIRDLNRCETWVCVPESGSQFANIAHIWDEKRDTWVTRDLMAARYGTTGVVSDLSTSETWDSDSDPWDTDYSVWNANDDGIISRVLIAEENDVYLEDLSSPVDTTINLVREDLVFDDDTEIKQVTRVTVRGTGAGMANLQIRLGARDSTNASITWQSFETVEPDGNPVECTGRYISYELQATGADALTVNRIIFEVYPTGPF